MSTSVGTPSNPEPPLHSAEVRVSQAVSASRQRRRRTVAMALLTWGYPVVTLAQQTAWSRVRKQHPDGAQSRGCVQQTSGQSPGDSTAKPEIGRSDSPRRLPFPRSGRIESDVTLCAVRRSRIESVTGSRKAARDLVSLVERHSQATNWADPGTVPSTDCSTGSSRRATSREPATPACSMARV